MNKRPIIIDTDPGIDDAIALAVALFDETLDVKLITTVAGNVSLDLVTDNTLKLLAFWDKKIPVAKGADLPLIRPSVNASNVHGASGMDGYDFPEGDYSNLLEGHAIHHMARVIHESKEKVTLVPIGPLTNIALLFKVYPEVKANIDSIVLMGGSASRGNMGVMSEFNIHVDPEAAKIVFDSGLPIVMAGLDIGNNALVYPEDSIKIKEFGKTGEMIYSLLQRYRGKGLQNGLKMFDSTAIAYLLKPEIYEAVDTHVTVELTGTYATGATIVDLRGYLNQPNNAKVLLGIDTDMFKDWLLESLKKCP